MLSTKYTSIGNANIIFLKNANLCVNTSSYFKFSNDQLVNVVCNEKYLYLIFN